jgi:hypothetical protein
MIGLTLSLYYLTPAPISPFKLAGKNSHHIIEATFKAFARALRQATEYNLRRRGTIPRFVFAYCKVCSENSVS